MSRLLQLLAQTDSGGDICDKTRSVVTSLFQMIKWKDLHMVWRLLSKLVVSLVGTVCSIV